MGILTNFKTLLGIEKKSNQSSAQTVSSQTQQTAATTPNKKILLVEDDSYLIDMYGDKFTHEGYEVIKARNGQEGLDMLVAHKPDAAILDLMMPVMDGKTMLKKLRDMPEFKTLPVIILTNAGQVDNIRETTRYYDAVAFFIKSNVDLNELVGTVRVTIG